jgi:hypothetical protein
LAKKGETLKSLERWKAEMPTEAEMMPRDKYTMFDRKAKRYRKGIHSMFPSGPCDCSRAVWLTSGFRAPQVDPCVPKNQPPWFLDDEERWFGVYILCTIPIGINGVMTVTTCKDWQYRLWK